MYMSYQNLLLSNSMISGFLKVLLQRMSIVVIYNWKLTFILPLFVSVNSLIIDRSPLKPEILDRSPILPKWWPSVGAPSLFVVIGHLWLFWAHEHCPCLHKHFLCSDGPSIYGFSMIKILWNENTWFNQLINPDLVYRIWCKVNDFLNHLSTSKNHQAVHILSFDRTELLC